LAGSLKVAKNFRVYLPQFGALSEISDQNFQNYENIWDILKKIFDKFEWILLVVESKSKNL